MKKNNDKAGSSVGEVMGTRAPSTRTPSQHNAPLSRQLNMQSNLTLNIPNLNTRLPRLDELNDSGMTGIGELNLENNTTIGQNMH